MTLSRSFFTGIGSAIVVPGTVVAGSVKKRSSVSAVPHEFRIREGRAVRKPGVPDSRGPPEQADQGGTYFATAIAGLGTVTLSARLGEVGLAGGCVARVGRIGGSANRKQQTVPTVNMRTDMWSPEKLPYAKFRPHK